MWIMITWKILIKKTQYDLKIAGLKANIEHWKNLEQREPDPVKKLLYKSAKELCIVKKSYMEVKAGLRPESEEVLSMIQEEAQRNDLTRFERFKKWSKENITGVSAVAISVAGVVTAAVMAGRNAAKKVRKLWEISEKRSPTSQKSRTSDSSHFEFCGSGYHLGSKSLRISF